jgi:hypothetical protein
MVKQECMSLRLSQCVWCRATYAAVPDTLVAPLMKGVMLKTRSKALKKKTAAKAE